MCDWPKPALSGKEDNTGMDAKYLVSSEEGQTSIQWEGGGGSYKTSDQDEIWDGSLPRWKACHDEESKSGLFSGQSCF